MHQTNPFYTMTCITLPYPQTRESAYQFFLANGISIRQWANEAQLPYTAVKNVLRERTKGTRGQSHKAAVALGLKPNPEKTKTKDI